MKCKPTWLTALFLLFAFSRCSAQQAEHVTLTGRDVAVWKPTRAADASGYPLIVFSHGFTGSNTQTKFLMQALAQAGYLVVAPNHKDACCGSGRHFGNGGRKPEIPFHDAGRWTDTTYRDRRDDIEAVLNAVLSRDNFAGLPVDRNRIGIAGHSLGGYTVLGLAGGWASWKDPRVKAVLALSPYCAPFLAAMRLKEVSIPVMYQGGTRDFGITPTVKKTRGLRSVESAKVLRGTRRSRPFCVDRFEPRLCLDHRRLQRRVFRRLLEKSQGRPDEVDEGRPSQGCKRCKSRGIAQLPETLLAHFRDMRGVMPAVPGVEKQQPIDRARTVFRVDEHAPELVIA